MWSSWASQVAQCLPCLPYFPSQEAVRGVRISEAYLDMGPLGSTQETPGRTTHYFTVLAHTGCIVLRSSQWRHAHRDIFCRGTRCIPLRLRCTENPGTFPSTHIHIQIHMAKTILVVCHTKQLQSAIRQIKRRDETFMESVHSGQHRKTKVSKKHNWLSVSAWRACWTTHKGTQGVDQKRRRPPQEQPGGRRNLLLHSQIYFWRDKCSEDESRLYSCNRCLSLVMPHDVRRYLDHTLAYTLAISVSAVIG